MVNKITNKMQNFINEQKNLAFVATHDEDGKNNVAPKSLLSIGEDSMMFGDLYMDQSAENLLANEHLTIAVIDSDRCTGYQFKGKAKIITKGQVFNTAKKRFEEIGFPEPIHAVELKVEEIFFFEQGPEEMIEAA